MGKKYTVAVCMCTYNGEKYIKEQLESIINQTVKPDQIVISDDCSSDNTLKIVKDILSGSGISYVINKNEKNLGIVANGNIIIDFCTCDIVCIADQDNVWDDRLIEAFLAKFEEDEKLEYAFCNGYVTDENLKVQKIIYSDDFMNRSNEEFLLDAINKIGFPHGNTVVCKRSFIIKSLPCMFAGDEWYALCAGAMGNIGIVKERLVYFRRHESSFSKSEGGGRKESFLQRIKHSDFDTFFVWPYSQYQAYDRYLDLYGDSFNEEIKESIKRHRDFELKINNIKLKNKITKVFSIIKLYKTDEYKKFRGNRNTLLYDVLFLLISYPL